MEIKPVQHYRSKNVVIEIDFVTLDEVFYGFVDAGMFSRIPYSMPLKKFEYFITSGNLFLVEDIQNESS